MSSNERLEIFSESFQAALIIERHGRMEKRHQADPAIGGLDGENPAMNLGNVLQLRLQSELLHQIGHGKAAQRADGLRLDNLDLAIQKRRVDPDLFRQRVAVVGRTVFNEVGDVDLLSLKLDGFDETFENAAGRPAERPALPSFGFARRLADQHDFGLVVAFADNREIMIS